MLALTEKILSEKMDRVVSRIQANIRNKKVTRFGAMNASGRTADSLHYEFRGNGVYLYGAGHIFRLETGNAPGTKVPFSNIRMWVDDKPITVTLTSRIDGTPRRHRDGSPITLEDQKDSVAWMIRNAINKKGTLLHQQGGNSGILSDVINQETEQDFIDALFFEFETVVTNQLLAA